MVRTALVLRHMMQSAAAPRAGPPGVSIVARPPTMAPRRRQAAVLPRQEPPATNYSHQHRAAVQLRYRIAKRPPFRREILPLQEAEPLSVPGRAGQADS